MDLEMSEAKDFYKDSGNEKGRKFFRKSIGIEPEYAKSHIFRFISLFLFGIASAGRNEKIKV